MGLYSCWCCGKLKKTKNYKGCLIRDRRPETKELINQLLKDINSHRQYDVVEIIDVRDQSGNDTTTS